MPQVVEVVGEPEEQGLADLHGQAAAWGARRKFSFDHREDGFDLGSLSVLFLRKSSVHLITNSPSRDAAARFGGNDATGSPALPDIFVISFGIEPGIGQHLAHRHPLPGGIEQSRQCSRIAPRSLPRALRQQNLLLPIRYHQPLPPVPMTGPSARMLFDTASKKGADGVVGKPRAIDSRGNAHVRFAAAQAAHRFPQPAVDQVIVKPLQKTIQGGVVRHALQLQNFPQVAMLAKTHLGFAKGPVFLAHQTQHRQQLRLPKLVFAETAAVRRQDPLGHLQGHPGKRQESDFGHRPSCFLREHSLPSSVENSNR